MHSMMVWKRHFAVFAVKLDSKSAIPGNLCPSARISHSLHEAFLKKRVRFLIASKTSGHRA